MVLKDKERSVFINILDLNEGHKVTISIYLINLLNGAFPHKLLTVSFYVLNLHIHSQ